MEWFAVFPKNTVFPQVTVSSFSFFQGACLCVSAVNMTTEQLFELYTELNIETFVLTRIIFCQIFRWFMQHSGTHFRLVWVCVHVSVCACSCALGQNSIVCGDCKHAIMLRQKWQAIKLFKINLTLKEVIGCSHYITYMFKYYIKMFVFISSFCQCQSWSVKTLQTIST